MGPGQAEGPGPFSAGLHIQDFLPTDEWAEHSSHTSRAPVLEEALWTIGSDLPPLALPAAAGTGPAGPQEYDFRTILRPVVAASASPGSLQIVGGDLGSEGQQLWRDTHMQLGTCVPDRQVTLPSPQYPQDNSPQQWSSQATGQLPGHVSEGDVPTGGYASRIAPSQPRGNVHRHVSDASIRVGENVWDVAPSRPRWNVHGHVSQSHVMLGAPPGEAPPDAPRPRQSPADRASQSGLGLGAQSPGQDQEPWPPQEATSGSCLPQEASSSRGEGGLQDCLSAVAALGSLADGTPEEPGQWDTEQPCPVWGCLGA